MSKKLKNSIEYDQDLEFLILSEKEKSLEFKIYKPIVIQGSIASGKTTMAIAIGNNYHNPIRIPAHLKIGAIDSVDLMNHDLIIIEECKDFHDIRKFDALRVRCWSKKFIFTTQNCNTAAMLVGHGFYCFQIMNPFIHK